MSKFMLYLTFFIAIAGMLVCVWELFNTAGDGMQEYVNLFLFIMFSIIAIICAIIERDMDSEKTFKSK